MGILVSITPGSSTFSKWQNYPCLFDSSCACSSAICLTEVEFAEIARGNFSWPEVSDKVALHPRDPSVPEFLQLAPCAHADDLAVAASSFRSLMTTVSPAFVVVDSVAGLNLNHPKCYWVQHGIDSCQELLDWVSTNCEESSEIKMVKHAQYVGTMIGPEGHLHRWTAAGENSLKELGKSTGPPKALSSDWLTSKCLPYQCLDTLDP